MCVVLSVCAAATSVGNYSPVASMVTQLLVASIANMCWSMVLTATPASCHVSPQLRMRVVLPPHVCNNRQAGASAELVRSRMCSRQY